MTHLQRDGRSWRLGTATDVEWSNAGVAVGRSITAAIPPVFDAYATVVFPDGW